MAKRLDQNLEISVGVSKAGFDGDALDCGFEEMRNKLQQLYARLQD